MAYCAKCGKHLDSEARFCPGCGEPVQANNEPSSASRKETWEGSVHKCPNCGAPVGSFEAFCPVCGNELRDKEAADSVSELSKKLDQIESGRTGGRKRKKLSERAAEQSDIEQRKISLIRTYPIPNTVEDILEFVILASSNVEPGSYSSWNTGAYSKAVSEAWLAKCDQAIHKAEISFHGNPLVEKMHSIRDGVTSDIKKAKRKGIGIWAGFIGGPIILMIMLPLIINIVDPNRSTNEANRLESIVEDIEEDLDAGEYYRALLNAESLEVSTYVSEEFERQWEVNREYWIDRVVKEAAENGVDLSGKANELETEGSSSEAGQPSGFVSGFTDALESGKDEAQENIDEFNRIMSEIDNKPNN